MNASINQNSRRRVPSRPRHTVAALAAAMVATSTLVAGVASASPSAAEPPHPVKMSSATGTQAGAEKPEWCYISRPDTPSGESRRACFRMSNTVLAGDEIVLEGTSGWGDEGRTLNVLLRAGSDEWTWRDSIVPTDADEDDSVWATTDVRPDGTWSITTPFPTSENSRSTKESNVDALVRPGGVLKVDVIATKEGGTPRRVRAAGWFSVTRSAAAGEAPPRIVEQPRGARFSSENQKSEPSPKVASALPTTVMWENMHWTNQLAPPDIWGLWNPPSANQKPIVGPDYWPPYDDPIIELNPNRWRAIVVNEVGNAVSEPANFWYEPGGPTGDDPVDLAASELVEHPSLQQRFSTPKSIRRGQVLTIDLGTRWRALRFGSRIYKGEAFRTFGWRNADSTGKIKVRIPRNCSPGLHKLPVVDRGGRLHGWNYVTVTR